MLFDADVYDLKFNHECHELLSVGEGGACGDFFVGLKCSEELNDVS